MDDKKLLRHFRLMVTRPGKKTSPLGLIEAETEASAWLLADQLLQNKCAEEPIDPDSRVELVDPDGRRLEPPSKVGDHLTEAATARGSAKRQLG